MSSQVKSIFEGTCQLSNITDADEPPQGILLSNSSLARLGIKELYLPWDLTYANGR